MKTISLSKILFVAIALFACTSFNKTFSQDAKAEKKKQEAAKIKAVVVDSQHYVFIVQSALPMGGGMRQLSYGYEVVISKTKVVSYLPYFGRAYSADYNSTGSPLDFTTTNFTYTITDYKKGGWDIVIKINDVKDAKTFAFTIFENGSAALQVTSNNRQPISFNGYVEAVKPKKEESK